MFLVEFSKWLSNFRCAIHFWYNPSSISETLVGRSSDGHQPSLSVPNLNHNTLQLEGQWWLTRSLPVSSSLPGCSLSCARTNIRLSDSINKCFPHVTSQLNLCNWILQRLSWKSLWSVFHYYQHFDFKWKVYLKIWEQQQSNIKWWIIPGGILCACLSLYTSQPTVLC